MRKCVPRPLEEIPVVFPDKIGLWGDPPGPFSHWPEEWIVLPASITDENIKKKMQLFLTSEAPLSLEVRGDHLYRFFPRMNDIFCKQPWLVRLELSECKLEPESIRGLADLLYACPNIQELSLWNTRVCIEGYGPPGRTVHAGMTPYQQWMRYPTPMDRRDPFVPEETLLDFNDPYTREILDEEEANNVGRASWRRFTNYIATARTLRAFALGSAMVSEWCMKNLASALAKNRSIIELSLGGIGHQNRTAVLVHAEGTFHNHHVAELVLKENTTVQHIEMGAVSDTMAQRIFATVLRDHPSVRSVDLSSLVPGIRHTDPAVRAVNYYPENHTPQMISGEVFFMDNMPDVRQLSWHTNPVVFDLAIDSPICRLIYRSLMPSIPLLEHIREKIALRTAAYHDQVDKAMLLLLAHEIGGSAFDVLPLEMIHFIIRLVLVGVRKPFQWKMN